MATLSNNQHEKARSDGASHLIMTALSSYFFIAVQCTSSFEVRDRPGMFFAVIVSWLPDQSRFATRGFARERPDLNLM
jgi:hypothetical protein